MKDDTLMHSLMIIGIGAAAIWLVSRQGMAAVPPPATASAPAPPTNEPQKNSIGEQNDFLATLVTNYKATPKDTIAPPKVVIKGNNKWKC